MIIFELIATENANVPCMAANIGQNCSLDDLNMGSPSKLKFSVIVISRSILHKTFSMLLLMPLYHILPFSKTVIGRFVGVRMKVLLSFGKNPNPAAINIFSRPVIALAVILC